MSAVKRTRGKNVLARHNRDFEKRDSLETGTEYYAHLRAGSVPKIFGNAFGVDSQGHKYHT